jgi:glycosyltransferase involved in cell wall biosynthesis
MVVDHDLSASSPLVSVIIASYNRERYLEEAVQSVIGQTFSNLECLIVDDGSTDHTRKVSEELMRKDQRIKYLYKENGGVSSARNFGIEQAKGEWIQFLDADDWLHHDKLRLQLDYMKNYDAERVVLYCDQERVYEGENRREVFYEYDASSKEKMIEKLLTPWALQCNGFLLKKSVATRATFDTRLSCFEDCKYELDLLMKDISFVHTPIIGHFYRIHQSNTSSYCGVADSTPKIQNAYIKYFTIVQEEYKSLKPICQERLVDYLKRTIETKDTKKFNEILAILDMPVKLYGIKFKTKNQLKFLQTISLYIPLLEGVYNLVRRLKD